MNLYRGYFVPNGTDPYGLDIYLITGNNTWNPLNNILHQKICVDTWNQDKKNNEWKAEKVCLAFAATGLFSKEKSNTWLGWSKKNIGCPMEGVTYWDASVGTVDKTIKTSRMQDEKYFRYLWGRHDLKDTYNFTLNCRTFAQMEFKYAKSHY